MTQAQTSPTITSRELEHRLGELKLENRAPVGDEELEKFRKQWRDEVLKKRQPAVSASASAAPGAASRNDVKQAGKADSKGKEEETYRTTDISPERTKIEHEPDHRLGSPSSTSHRSLSPSTSPRVPTAALRNVDPSFLFQESDDGRVIVGPSSGSNHDGHGVHASDASRPDEAGGAAPKSPQKRMRAMMTGMRGRRLGVQDMDAVSIYAKAVEAEQAGQLNDALNLYRQAFKMDDNVDRTYAANRARAASKASQLEPSFSSLDPVSSTVSASQPYSFQRTIQTAPDYDPHHPLSSSLISPNTRASPLTRLFYTRSPAPAEAQFEPANEDLPVRLASLPGELLENVMSHLDVAAIENFGSTCWKARFMTAHSEYWRVKAGKMYAKAAINPEGVGMGDLGKKYGGEWRTCLIEQERVRMDGCYIAVCHYVRPGAGDEWVTITHTITYHRFLRFYPDGTVISFLTTDHPADVVPQLKPTLRGKGLHFGTYTILPPTADPIPEITPCADPANLPQVPQVQQVPQVPQAKTKAPKQSHRILISELLEPGASSPKYEFEMELSLRETSRGKWNKLDILEYRSINLATGEVMGLGLKHQKPFYFSKVRSYLPAL